MTVMEYARSSRGGAARRLATAAILGLLFFSTVPSGFSQDHLRRGGLVQPVAQAEKGDFLLGFGAGYELNVSVPLVAVGGGPEPYRDRGARVRAC